jgi:hypothetical protein
MQPACIDPAHRVFRNGFEIGEGHLFLAAPAEQLVALKNIIAACKANVWIEQPDKAIGIIADE